MGTRKLAFSLVQPLVRMGRAGIHGSRDRTSSHAGHRSTLQFGEQHNTLYHDSGDWQFDDVSYQWGEGLPSMPYVKWGDAFFDVDNDGWLDLIFVSGHVYPQVASLGGTGYQSNPVYCNSTRKTEHFAMRVTRRDQP